MALNLVLLNDENVIIIALLKPHIKHHIGVNMHKKYQKRVPTALSKIV